MPKWLSDACGASGTGTQGEKGEPFKGDKSELNYCRSFDPVCKENASQPWYKLPDPVSAPGKSPVRAGDVEGRCSGDWTSGLIVDQIAIPADLKAGDYVLGWRWDCAHTMPAALRGCLVMPHVRCIVYTITLVGLLAAVSALRRGNHTGMLHASCMHIFLQSCHECELKANDITQPATLVTNRVWGCTCCMHVGVAELCGRRNCISWLQTRNVVVAETSGVRVAAANATPQVRATRSTSGPSCCWQKSLEPRSESGQPLCNACQLFLLYCAAM